MITDNQAYNILNKCRQESRSASESSELDQDPDLHILASDKLSTAYKKSDYFTNSNRPDNKFQKQQHRRKFNKLNTQYSEMANKHSDI